MKALMNATAVKPYRHFAFKSAGECFNNQVKPYFILGALKYGLSNSFRANALSSATFK